jgi:hypothetical protein
VVVITFLITLICMYTNHMYGYSKLLCTRTQRHYPRGLGGNLAGIFEINSVEHRTNVRLNHMESSDKLELNLLKHYEHYTL